MVGSLMNDIGTQLAGLLENAAIAMGPEIKTLREEYQDVFNDHLFRLRPSAGSVSIVSCRDNTPQLGRSGCQNISVLKRELDALRMGTEVLKQNGWDRPEKKLQSWLLARAMANDGELKEISNALNDSCRYWVVSDELAFTDNKRELSDQGDTTKFVADLLLIREDASGRARFCNVELKYARSTVTFKQVERFRAVLENEKFFGKWQDFAKLMLNGKTFTHWDRESCGMVIWPALAAGQSTSALTLGKLKKCNRIDTLGFHRPDTSIAEYQILCEQKAQ
jgi:hypothetical protein